MARVDLTDEELEYLMEVLEHWQTLGMMGEVEDKTPHLSEPIGEKLRAAFDRPERRCAHCGAELKSTNPKATTCSDSCRQALSRRMRKVRADALKAAGFRPGLL